MYIPRFLANILLSINREKFEQIADIIAELRAQNIQGMDFNGFEEYQQAQLVIVLLNSL